MKNPSKPETTDPAPSQEIFDVPKVRRFVQMMKEYGLTELEIRQGETSISLKRGGMAPMMMPAETYAVPQMPMMAAAPAVSAPAVAAPAEVKDESHMENITSPIVGTFYSRPSPDAAAFVSVGDLISPGKAVCIVEAMKVFNQIPSKIAGKIVAMLVKDGDAVEFGQPLFKVDTRG